MKEFVTVCCMWYLHISEMNDNTVVKEDLWRLRKNQNKTIRGREERMKKGKKESY